MNSLLNEQHKWIAEYFDFTSRERQWGLMEQFHSDVARQEQTPVFEGKPGSPFSHNTTYFVLSATHYCSLLLSIWDHVLIVEKWLLQWFSFSIRREPFWIHQMACFARADSASCLHCNSAWDVHGSRDVIEGLASCTLHSTIPPTHINLYKSAVVFAAGKPPSSLKLGQGTPAVSGKCAHRGSCTRMWSLKC